MSLVDAAIDNSHCLPRAAVALRPGSVGARNRGRVMEHGIERPVLGDAGHFRVGEQRGERSGIDCHHHELVIAQPFEIAQVTPGETLEHPQLPVGDALRLDLIQRGVYQLRNFLRGLQPDDHAHFTLLAQRREQVVAGDLAERVMRGSCGSSRGGVRLLWRRAEDARKERED